LDKCCKRNVAFRSKQEGIKQEDFQAVLKAAEETVTMQRNVPDWLELDEGGPRFQLLMTENILSVLPIY
jgi:hypothetical protein